MADHLRIGMFPAISQKRYFAVTTDLLDVPLNNHVAVFWVKFHHAARAVGLLGRNQRGAGAPKEVERNITSL